MIRKISMANKSSLRSKYGIRVKIFMRAVLGLVVVITCSFSQAEMCDSKITNYYRNAEVNQFPAKPIDPITSADAEELEKNGDEYYIHVICNSGEPISLTKRWNKKLYFEVKYLYKDDKLIGQKSTNANGETNEYYVE